MVAYLFSNPGTESPVGCASRGNRFFCTLKTDSSSSPLLFDWFSGKERVLPPFSAFSRNPAYIPKSAKVSGDSARSSGFNSGSTRSASSLLEPLWERLRARPPRRPPMGLARLVADSAHCSLSASLPSTSLPLTVPNPIPRAGATSVAAARRSTSPPADATSSIDKSSDSVSARSSTKAAPKKSASAAM